MQKKVPPNAGIQQGLDELAKSGEFTTILNQEVQARKLNVMNVMAWVNDIYYKVSKRTKGNDDIVNDNIIIVRTPKYNDNERAALVTFLKVKDNWPNPLDWKEGNIQGRQKRM